MPILPVEESHFENHGPCKCLLYDCVKGIFWINYVPQELLWEFPNFFTSFFWKFLECMSPHRQGRMAHFANWADKSWHHIQHLSCLGQNCSSLETASEKAMAPHSRTLACKIPWTEEPGGLQSMGSLRVGQDWANSLSIFTFMHWRRKWQPTPVFLPGESQGQGSLVGCRLWGCTVGHDWSNLAAAAAAETA